MIEQVLIPIIFIGLAYLLGSIPVALIVTHWRTNRDLREHGSGHAGATNVMRLAGWAPALFVLLWDMGKGFLVVALAARVGPGWLQPLSAVAVVVGHCWPVFAGFQGGMGVATTGGALLASWPLGFVLGIGLDAALTLLLRHAARANVVTGLTLWLVLLLFGAKPLTLYLTAGVSLVVVIRSLRDWRRQYRELWLDRQEEAGPKT